MDVGFYLGELLMQQGKVKVPGLGNFLQVRMSAYYDENESLFYPPYSKVHFEPLADIDDAELADYLVNKKGISLASAQYFIEKYITNLRQQAIVADVPLGNMGVFFTDRGQLSFKSNDKLADDSQFYGYAAVKINKVNALTADAEQLPEPELVYPRPKSQPEITETFNEEKDEPVAEENIEETISATYDEAFLDLPEQEEEESRGPLRAILIMFVVIAILATGVFALYRYQPATFNTLQFWKNNKATAPVKPAQKVIVVPKTDTINTDTANIAFIDSLTITAVADTVPKPRFELLVNVGYKTIAAANAAIEKYRGLGLLNTALSSQKTGTLVKVSVGTFYTRSESEAMKKKLIKEGKLSVYARTKQLPNK